VNGRSSCIQQIYRSCSISDFAGLFVDASFVYSTAQVERLAYLRGSGVANPAPVSEEVEQQTGLREGTKPRPVPLEADVTEDEPSQPPDDSWRRASGG